MRARTIALCVVVAYAFISPARAAGADCVALRFDDGPSPHTTPQLLDILEREHVRATFFVIGENARSWPDIVKREADDGDEVGNHSWDHPLHFNRLSLKKTLSEFEKADDAIERATGSRPSVIGAPGGEINGLARSRITRPLIGWDVDTDDWMYKNRNSDRVYKAAINVQPGQIVLMHDIRPTTVEAVSRIIAGLKACGLLLVTIAELQQKECAQPARTSSR